LKLLNGLKRVLHPVLTAGAPIRNRILLLCAATDL